MCVCIPLCTQFEGDWPEEQCPNPDCTDTAKGKPVNLIDFVGSVGLTFHCHTCPCRWYSVYEVVKEATS
ncbi:hypothetical protein [Streptomyces sp. NPDC052496]|uniref:hypothetical protein n=1 Tax=Streptomyces sp. NPDC052496 TaxID=3154951 RepID=UPI0034123260